MADGDLVAHIRESELGADLVSQTPFGARPVVYTDYTASGRSLSFIEDYVRDALLPTYGNTHTSTTKTGRQSSDFVAEARTMIKNYLRCGKHDRLIFAGSGATAGANKLVTMLGLTASTVAARDAARELPEAERPLVLVGPYEHHSNLLPWRDSIADVLSIGESAGGGIDLSALEAALRANQHRRLLVGAFSAASNVTGVLSEVDDITALLHTHNALAIWDYASAAPYAVNFHMNPAHEDAERAALTAKDALFFSPHKFAGGPQAGGVLVYKKALCTRGVSSSPGGGTVFYVSDNDHVYVKNDEEREEGGTPAIIGAIRAGLVMQLQKAVGAPAIARADHAILERAYAAWGAHPHIAILGHPTAPRLPIFALAISVAGGPQNGVANGVANADAPSAASRRGPLLLHHNYVVALLNDLFGIQARGGCMCAGPYSQSLLGIDTALSDAMQTQLVKKEDNELLRPGYVRVSLPYFADDLTIQYVLDAVTFVASHGWELLPQYTCDAATAEWRHVHQKRPPRAWLGGVSYEGGQMSWSRASGDPQRIRSEDRNEDACRARFESALAEAHAVAKIATSELRRNTGAILSGQSLGDMLAPDAAPLRWFVLPAEAQMMHKGTMPAASSPFCPPRFATAAAVPPTPSGATAPDLADESGPRPGVKAKTGKAAKRSRKNGGDADAALGWAEPDKKLANKVLRAVLQHGMLRPGDRVLLGLSGGKDSLCLLHVLHALQKRTPFKWELGACTVDPKADGFDPSPLIPYLAKLGIPYFYEAQDLLAIAEPCMAKEGNRVSICSFCSRMKRGVLYATARREGYNVLAMAQHLDDLAESFLMSALHNGALRSMKAHYLIDAKDIRVIRPLAYVREVEAEAFSEAAHLPIISETCPACFEAPKERYRTKCLLATQEALFPNLFQSLLRTLLPLTEPQIEDQLRLRREAFGRIQGPPHVPPPMAPPSAADEEAAQRAQATHGQYDARLVWSASLALSRQRLVGGGAGGGRGCSLNAEADPTDAANVEASDMEALATSWFGGSLDTEGNFVPAGKAHAHGLGARGEHKHGTPARPAGKHALNGHANGHAHADGESPSVNDLDSYGRWTLALALGASMLSIAVASVARARGSR